MNILKSLFRAAIFSIASLLATSCVVDGELTSFGVFFIVILVIIVIGAVITIANNAQDEAAAKEKQAQLQQQLVNERAQKRIEENEKKIVYDEKCADLVAEMGMPDKTIVIEQNDINKEIRAYSALNKVTILGKNYDFASILSCSYNDDSWVEKGQTTITSTGTAKTDNGSMLGRAIVGGVVAGGAGAIIGGSTAKKNTETTSVVNQGNDILHHKYTVLISVKDIANPLIKIPLGNKGDVVNEIVALMNAIIANNQ